MDDDKNSSGSGLHFEQLDFDLLERSLQNQSSSEMVFQTLSIWLWGRLDVEFVAFCFSKKSDAQYVKTSDDGNIPSGSSVFQERKENAVSKNGVFVHSSGYISFPLEDFSNISEKVLLVIGKDKASGASFRPEEYRKFNPIIRILNKSLLYFTAELLNEEKSRLQYAFSRYVSPELVQNIISDGKAIDTSGEKQCLSVIFTDLKDFTSLTEEMNPPNLVRVLNMYLTEMTQVIISLGGTIDKFEGDAIMAFFGAPHRFPDHAVRCCLSALRMKKMENILNEQLLHEKLIQKPLFTRIGINTGDMIVGNIGSLQRLDYTIIGSNVNIASRIEDINKVYGTSVLISGETFRLVAPYFNCEYCDTAFLKGVKDAVPLYKLISEKENIPFYGNFENSEPASEMELLEPDL
ncbi:adenylate/guanylate cyclase domain-containing protein [Treponema parvum]|uniref:Adenylate/guanylate cyclase domain-containing protein n=1 Tax=Treponema parvum TaxID=138851 RepID=A0A975IBY0_9SPIR|nr:adenylate/guanylate cyclase domain-containing protein [Treponema parvum]QTQ11446.1 adenylate/guanylate cyclase domain-containing protein [Treponema parvum]